MEREKKCLAEFLEDYDDEKDDHRFYRVRPRPLINNCVGVYWSNLIIIFFLLIIVHCYYLDKATNALFCTLKLA